MDMPEKNDPFQDYYDEASKSKGETAKEIIESLEKKANEGEAEVKEATSDAKLLRGSINEFIRKLNSYIGDVFRLEKDKGTPPDLIVTLVVGGLAFTLANVYYLLTKNLNSPMSKEDYEETFLNMYRSAIKNIGKTKE